jgi:hypothetical protein
MFYLIAMFPSIIFAVMYTKQFQCLNSNVLIFTHHFCSVTSCPVPNEHFQAAREYTIDILPS